MKSIAPRATLALTSIVVGGTGALAASSAAVAGSDESIVTARGSVAWFHDGDQVVACDAKADGRSIEANYRLAGDTTTGRVLHAAGAGNCRTVTWDKTEGANVQIRMCYRDGIIVTTCSNWQNAEA